MADESMHSVLHLSMLLVGREQEFDNLFCIIAATQDNEGILINYIEIDNTCRYR